MNERTPYDGKPYYCADCGAGLGEFYACEWPTCSLESEDVAKARAAKQVGKPGATEAPRNVTRLRKGKE